MEHMTRWRTAGVLVAVGIALSGCTAESGASPHPSNQSHSTHLASPSSSAAAGHDHAAEVGTAPEGIQEASDPRFPVGTEVTLAADHMPGMDGATAEVSGRWTGTVYMVDYAAAGKMMKNHKWVVEDEIQPAK